jgi:hypothetical protein
MRVCPGCGNPSTDETRECPHCGTAFSGWLSRLRSLLGGSGERAVSYDAGRASSRGAEGAAVSDAERGPFLLVVEDTFSIRGRGTVVTGRVASGRIAVGEQVRCSSPGGNVVTCTVTGVEMFRKIATEARAGDNVGLLLSSEVRGEDVPRGTRIEAANRL